MMKKETTKQSASEKRLFKELQDLRVTVGHLYKMFDDRLNAADARATLSTTAKQDPKQDPKPKPKNYVLTDADWQRVIEEGYLCEFGTYYGGFPALGCLVKRDDSTGEYWLAGCKAPWENCRLLNKPGVMQPYFGQGMPVHASTRVMVKFQDGYHGIGKAVDYSWGGGGARGIVAFMVLE